jgi:predicted ATPase
MAFRLSHEDARRLLDDLVEQEYLRDIHGRYELSPAGLRGVGGEHARSELKAFNDLIPVLKDCYRSGPTKNWSAAEIAERACMTPEAVGRTLVLLEEGIPWSSAGGTPTARLYSLVLKEEVLDLRPERWPELDVSAPVTAPNPRDWRLQRIEIDGYRLFRGFHASLGDLIAVIGANGTGKSSLLDFMRWVSFAAANPLPAEMEPFSAGKRLFHADGPSRVGFRFEVALGGRPGVAFAVEIDGPVPKVQRETLRTLERVEGFESEWTYIERSEQKARFWDLTYRASSAESWPIPPNELALRKAVDPRMVFLSSFRTFVTSWKFYSSLTQSRPVKVGQPVLTEPEPELAADGSNLGAVLHFLITEHRDAWEHLETHLRSVVPGFQSLTVKARGPRGNVAAVWRERAGKEELSLADLSDGTLLFLTWAALCLSPNLPPLICIDEPELGLHPRALPVLASLFREASARSQIILTTHSPDFLSQFSLDEFAVMRREGDGVAFLRPGTSQALRSELEEIGGDALARMHISYELETRS